MVLVPVLCSVEEKNAAAGIELIEIRNSHFLGLLNSRINVKNVK
jgi:hypothetical protein